MKTGCLALAFLVLAGNALAKTPQLIVRGATDVGAGAATTVEVKGTANDAASANVSVYVPKGYTVNLGQTAGITIGTLAAHALLAPSNAITVIVGTIVVADRSDPKLQAAATQCTDTPTHAAIWLLHVLFGSTGDIPVYVDPTAGAEAAFSSAKLELCLANPYAQAVPGTRPPNGAKIFDAKLTLSAGVLTSPPSAGRYVWRALVTPWALNGTAENPVRTVEAQGIVSVPSLLTLHGAKKAAPNSVLLSGRLLEDTAGVRGARVVLFANGRRVGVAKTRPTGAFAKTVRIRKATWFKATATVRTHETACARPLPVAFAPRGCVSATFAGYRIRSETVRVFPSKL